MGTLIVKSFMCGLGKLDFLHIHQKAVLRFHKKLSYSGDSVIKISCYLGQDAS